jgi:uncharacterized membrane protein YqgA involved in biofilm formation
VVTGPFINASAVLVGGVLGALLSQRLPERIRTSMTSIFGLASLGIGILLVIKCANLPVMVLSTLVGTLLGEICNMEKGINTLVSQLQQLLTPKGKKKPRLMSPIFRAMWRLSSCSAPAAPASSAPCAKG